MRACARGAGGRCARTCGRAVRISWGRSQTMLRKSPPGISAECVVAEHTTFGPNADDFVTASLCAYVCLQPFRLWNRFVPTLHGECCKTTMRWNTTERPQVGILAGRSANIRPHSATLKADSASLGRVSATRAGGSAKFGLLRLSPFLQGALRRRACMPVTQNVVFEHRKCRQSCCRIKRTRSHKCRAALTNER